MTHKNKAQHKMLPLIFDNYSYKTKFNPLIPVELVYFIISASKTSEWVLCFVSFRMFLRFFIQQLVKFSHHDLPFFNRTKKPLVMLKLHTIN
jgi:hypothetical protein